MTQLSLRTIPVQMPAPMSTRQQDDDLAQLCKAIAHPHRQALLRLLAAHPGTYPVEQLVPHFPLAQPTISHHLRILVDAHLLTGTKRGTYIFYEVDITRYQAAIDTLLTVERLFFASHPETPERMPVR